MTNELGHRVLTLHVMTWQDFQGTGTGKSNATYVRRGTLDIPQTSCMVISGGESGIKCEI